MLEGLDIVDWAGLSHAYGPATDVPDLMRALLSEDEEARASAEHALYSNVFHQGSRYEAAVAVVPFLIELAGSPATPDRGWVLSYLRSLVNGYFDVRARGFYASADALYARGTITPRSEVEDADVDILAAVSRAAVEGAPVLLACLADEGIEVRATGAGVLAGLPDLAAQSVPRLRDALELEVHAQVRTAMVFALGELGDVDTVRARVGDDSALVQLMALCQLALHAPEPGLVAKLVPFLQADLAGYANCPGAGGPAPGDAAAALAILPSEYLRDAIPALSGALEISRSFDCMPVVRALVTAAFEPRAEPITALTARQADVLGVLVSKEEIWTLANLSWVFKGVGLPSRREDAGAMLGVSVRSDEAASRVRSARLLASMGHYAPAAEAFAEARAIDPLVMERVVDPEEAWLRLAEVRAFDDDRQGALEAVARAVDLDPSALHGLSPRSPLFAMLQGL